MSAEEGWHWREDYARLHDGTFDETDAGRQAVLAERMSREEPVPNTRLRALVPHAVLPEQLAKVAG